MSEMMKKKRNRRLPKGIMWGIAALVIFFVAAFVISFFVVRRKVTDSLFSDIKIIQAGVADLEHFNPQAAERQFSLLQNTSSTLGGIWSGFQFLFKKNPVSSVADLSSQLAMLSQEEATIPADAASFALSGRGATFLADLQQLQSTLHSIDADTDTLSSAASFTGSGIASLGFGDSYLSSKTELKNAEQFLDAFIPWFSSSTPHHALALFENSSELRPGGGFLGSYADIAVQGGNITSVSVHDIADVDRAFHQNIIPPAPLQLEVTGFRPADGNWFFDFPTSASETISLFNASDLFTGSTTFDTAIAISPKVVSDLLSLTGPLTVTATGTPRTTFDQNNFLVQVQKIVQAGQAKSATYPKAILNTLAQAITAQLASTSTDSASLASMAEDWITKKEVMAYSADPDIEHFLAGVPLGGASYELPQQFNGDYLALADTDVNGDKSEQYVSSTVNFVSQINADGTVNDALTINRTHHGSQSPYWWYRTSNQDYLQIFVPPDAVLTNETGGKVKKISPSVNYAAQGYVNDPLISAIAVNTESTFEYPAVLTHEEDGKKVFATWSLIHRGESAELSFSYTHHLFLAPTDGEQYQFVFEKQAGSRRDYHFEIYAPLGFVFAENGLSSYTYDSSDIPSRLVIALTLQKFISPS